MSVVAKIADNVGVPRPICQCLKHINFTAASGRACVNREQRTTTKSVDNSSFPGHCMAGARPTRNHGRGGLRLNSLLGVFYLGLPDPFILTVARVRLHGLDRHCSSSDLCKKDLAKSQKPVTRSTNHSLAQEGGVKPKEGREGLCDKAHHREDTFAKLANELDVLGDVNLILIFHLARRYFCH